MLVSFSVTFEYKCVAGCVVPGVLAFSDQRGPAADPPGPGLGASGGGPLRGAGGLFTQQVD